MKRPSIIVKYHKDFNKSYLKEVVAGIEEEGVLYTLIPVEEQVDAFTLSMDGVYMSPIEIGIGLSGDKAVLSVKKLKDRPLFYTDKGYRSIGQNAARYVKGRPFIPMEKGQRRVELENIY